MAAASMGAAASSSTVVTADIPSATNLTITGCAPGTASTSIGVVQPGTVGRSSAACTLQFGSSNDTSMLRLYQQDHLGAGMFQMTDGTFDTGFGTGGWGAVDPGNDDDGAGVAVLPDGKLLVAGHTQPGANENVVLARYNANGTPDLGFGGGTGYVVTAVTTADDRGQDIAVQDDGKIVVAGYNAVGAGDSAFTVIRYQGDGQLDTDFGIGGIRSVNLGNGLDVAYDVAIDSQGRIVVVGLSDVDAGAGIDFDMAIVRLDANGDPDLSFAGTGSTSVNFGGAAGATDLANAVTIDPSTGRILVAGVGTPAAGDDDIAIAAFTSSGGLDGTFDSGDGKVVLDVSNVDAAYDVDIDANGRVVIAGARDVGVGTTRAVVAVFTGGAPDLSFGGGSGWATTSLGGTQDAVETLLIGPDGEYNLLGHTLNADWDIAAARFTAAGQPARSLDGDGTWQRVAAGQQVIHDAALHQDGSIVLAGGATFTDQDLAITRLSGNPVADYSIGTTDWTTGANAFGACLAAVTNATSTWSVSASTCPTATATDWSPIAALASGGTAKVASTAASVANATASMYFAFRPGAAQRPGTYVAPLQFEVVAPNA